MLSLCDIVRKLAWSNNVFIVATLAWLLFGAFHNIYLVFMLHKTWRQLGSVKVLILANAFASVICLALHVYLPVNAAFHNLTSRQWNLTSELCTVLPALSSITISVSLTTLTFIVLAQYMKIVHGHKLTMLEAENAVLSAWCIGALLGAPLLGLINTEWEPFYNVQICIVHWTSTWNGGFYGAWIIVIQYIIPTVITAAGVAKMLVFPGEVNPSRCCKFLLKFIDLLAAVVVLVAILFLPLRMAGFGSANSGNLELLVPKIFDILRFLEILSICVFVGSPFVLADLIKDEVYEYNFHLVNRGVMNHEAKNSSRQVDFDVVDSKDLRHLQSVLIYW